MHHLHSKATFILQANFPWAYATLGVRMGSACLEALAAQAQKQLPQFKPQNLANMMWAFAKLSYSPDATLLLSCEACASRIARTFKPQEVVRRCLFFNKQHLCILEMQVLLCSSSCSVLGNGPGASSMKHRYPPLYFDG